MKNKVQLITYADRFGSNGIKDLHKLLTNELHGVFEGGVHILPFYYPIDGYDAGFDPIDHQSVDSRIGGWEDISELASDYDIMADLIINHISADSKEFQDVLKRGSQSEYFELFLTLNKVFPEGAKENDLLKIYRPRPVLPYTKYHLQSGEECLFWTTFTEKQLDIDVLSRQGMKYVSEILNVFHHNGIKMIRIDAAGYAIKRQGTSCFMLPETYDFINNFTQQAKELGMQVLVEVHSHFKEQIKIAKQVDYVYDFALPPLVLHSFYTRSFDRLKEWLAVSPRNCVTVLDTHDGIGVTDVAGTFDQEGILSQKEIDAVVAGIHAHSKGQSKLATGGAASNLDIYQINCTFYDALGGKDLHYLMARAIQLFAPGIPQVYYAGLLACSNDMELLHQTNVGRDINRPYLSFEEVELALSKDVVKSFIELIKIRNKIQAFSGDFYINSTPAYVLSLEWINGVNWAQLNIDLMLNKMSIKYSEDKNERSLSFDLSSIRVNQSGLVHT